MTRLSVRVATAAAALAGVVLAHSVGALLAFSEAHHRAEHLAATGHGYWPAAVALAVAAGALAVAWTAAGGARPTGPGGCGCAPGFLALAGGQVGLFVAMEVVERLVAGAPVGELRHGMAFPLGLFVQVATAAVIALVLRRLHRLAAHIAARLRQRPRLGHARSSWRSIGQACPRSDVAGRVRSRAPPGVDVSRPVCTLP